MTVSRDEHPDRIGRYRILKPIGDGAMGTVYLAQQWEPIRRRVALKVIKLGMNTQRVVARFENELKILARLNHSHIAKVHDAGTTPTGMPYFVMEYIEGESMTRHCDQHRLSIDARLSLFISVCDAVQHAHQKGIIHRDLKPSNVLVQGKEAQPKVIDFGIAKATDSSRSEATLVTQEWGMVGTPAYMSPEQADRSPDIDARSDIYSLGMLLYELLVGVSPFDREDLRSAADIQRAIRELEPRKPSTRLDPNGDPARTIAQDRRLRPAELSRRLKGDLDAITLKALEKDRNRRYESAAQLAEDIARHQSHKPVRARPPRTAYRLLKFARKNRLLVTTAAGVLIVLGMAFTFSTSEYLRAQEQARLSQERYREVRRLGDIKRLAYYRTEVDTLWPALPAMIPRMEAWLQKAHVLSDRRPQHRATLERLRQQLPEQAQAVLERPPTRSRTWRFLDQDLVWYRDTLAAFLTELELFCDPDPRIGAIADLEARLRFARTVGKVSLENHREAWERAIASISNPKECPAYQGLVIAPQMGLVPLGHNPATGLWEFWHVETGRRPEPGPESPNQWRLEEDTGLVFILIPGGAFMMGAQNSDPREANYDPHCDIVQESPLHRVHLDPFFASKYEMTQAQWLGFVGENPSQFRPDSSDGASTTLLHPVEQVSWIDCHRVLTRLGLELPTEAQLEYAGRAGTATVWWTGDHAESLSGAANLAESLWRNEYAYHAPVGTLRPNAFGLHHVSGNVSEWCRDWSIFYRFEPRRGDGLREGGQENWRAMHGGSFRSSPTEARSAYRRWGEPELRLDYVGVRPARKIEN